MSNRMSVLSRRLGRFAVCFSVITFCLFLFGLYANANNQAQTVSLVAVLASVCFFATFFLWLAHGFAWAMIPERPAGAKKSAESMMPEEPMMSAEVLRPAEALKPQEPVKSVEPMKPIQPTRPAEVMKAREEKVIPAEDSANAKYTITGRRIL